MELQRLQKAEQLEKREEQQGDEQGGVAGQDTVEKQRQGMKEYTGVAGAEQHEARTVTRLAELSMQSVNFQPSSAEGQGTPSRFATPDSVTASSPVQSARKAFDRHRTAAIFNPNIAYNLSLRIVSKQEADHPGTGLERVKEAFSGATSSAFRLSAVDIQSRMDRATARQTRLAKEAEAEARERSVVKGEEQRKGRKRDRSPEDAARKRQRTKEDSRKLTSVQSLLDYQGFPDVSMDVDGSDGRKPSVSSSVNVGRPSNISTRSTATSLAQRVRELRSGRELPAKPEKIAGAAYILTVATRDKLKDLERRIKAVYKVLMTKGSDPLELVSPVGNKIECKKPEQQGEFEKILIQYSAAITALQKPEQQAKTSLRQPVDISGGQPLADRAQALRSVALSIETDVAELEVDAEQIKASMAEEKEERRKAKARNQKL